MKKYRVLVDLWGTEKSVEMVRADWYKMEDGNLTFRSGGEIVAAFRHWVMITREDI